MESDYHQVEVTYKFYLHDNKNDLRMVQLAPDMFSALWDIDQKCRGILKYGTDMKFDEVLEDIRAVISEVDLYSVD